jgi:hypothetical protein
MCKIIMFFCEWFCATGGCLSTNGCLLLMWLEIIGIHTRDIGIEIMANRHERVIRELQRTDINSFC